MITLGAPHRCEHDCTITKVCTVCRRAYHPLRYITKTQKYCEAECALIGRNVKPGKAMRKATRRPVELTCCHCGEAFTKEQQQKRQKFCSPECRQAAYNEKRTAQRAASTARTASERPAGPGPHERAPEPQGTLETVTEPYRPFIRIRGRHRRAARAPQASATPDRRPGGQARGPGQSQRRRGHRTEVRQLPAPSTRQQESRRQPPGL